MHEASLAFYATAGRFTDLGGLGDLAAVGLDAAAIGGVDDAVAIVQGLLIYDLVAGDFYGVELTPEQAEAIHERDSARLLEMAQSVDSRPLAEARPPAARVGARCHAFSRLTVALLRSAGIPARARCGFGAVFNPGWLEDHWVAEYWDAGSGDTGDGRWQMVDAQLDATWREMIGFDDDPLAITPDQFVTAGHAWQAWRRGDLDAGRCGLTSIDEHGAHWIAGNLRLDFAALNKVEMLPWDVWGAGWEPGQDPPAGTLELFDAVAALTVDPDRQLDELRQRYATDASLRMDGTVFSVARGRFETV